MSTPPSFPNLILSAWGSEWKSLHHIWSRHKYWKCPKYLFSLKVMSECQSIGICRICSECKSTVLQGHRCVRDVETSLLCDPLKSWRKCVLLAHTRWRNSMIHCWLMYKAEKAQGGRFAGPLSMKCESGGDAVLAKVCCCWKQLCTCLGSCSSSSTS